MPCCLRYLSKVWSTALSWMKSQCMPLARQCDDSEAIPVFFTSKHRRSPFPLPLEAAFILTLLALKQARLIAPSESADLALMGTRASNRPSSRLAGLPATGGRRD